MLNKSQVIDAILSVNPSARRAWLDCFNEDALRHYLDHLQLTIEPRGRESVWIRHSDTRAVVTRRSAA